MDIRSRGDIAGHEIRDWTSALEVRSADDSTVTFEGVASVVDTPYQVRDMFGEFTETITRGAFDKTLAGKSDMALFVSHNMNALPLATRSAGNLTLSADPHLRVSASLNAQRHDVHDARIAVADGLMRQMSIGFSVPKGAQAWNEDYTVRTINEVNLTEASLVWRGASPTTTAAVRALADILAEIDCDDPDEVRRAIAHLETLLPVERVDEVRAGRYTDLLAQYQDKREPVLT